MRTVSNAGADLPRQVRERLIGFIGGRGLVDELCARYHESWGGIVTAPCGLVVGLASTGKWATACTEAGVAVVPRGGNTGLAGGAQPARPYTAIIIAGADAVPVCDHHRQRHHHGGGRDEVRQGTNTGRRR